MKTYIIYLVSLFPTIICIEINPNCDYYDRLRFGQEYFIYNPEYPNNYSGPAACRWGGESPENSIIVITCDVNLPNSPDCQRDKLAFSPIGNANFQDDNLQLFCGKTTFTTYSYGPQMAFGLFSNSGGTGRFLCSIAAVRPAQNCQCGLEMERKIVGGQETGVHQYPFMAALIDNTRQIAFCGASIITTRHALTAAHCLTNQSPNNLGLLVGAHNLDQALSTNGAALYEIQTFSVIYSYNATYYQNDIAVVQTSNYIQFNLVVSPVCLPFRYGQYNFEGTQVIDLGWGFQDFSGYKANTLQEVELTVISNQQCAAQIPTITDTSLCTFTPGKDACIGDSGGPVVWKDPYTNRLELVALISYGYGCASNKPGINARISAFLSWIVSVTPGAEYCFQ